MTNNKQPKEVKEPTVKAENETVEEQAIVEEQPKEVTNIEEVLVEEKVIEIPKEKQVEEKETTNSNLIGKASVLEIISTAKARILRLSRTSISMPFREVVAMLNGLQDSVENLSK